MMFSIDVLPAPFGPMMARISPLRMSKETSLTAFTPPNDSEIFSTDKSTSPTATSGPLGALIVRLPLSYPSPERGGSARSAGVGSLLREPPPAATERGTARLQHRGDDRLGLHVADFDPRADRPFAAVLERHLGRDIGFLGAVIERLDQRAVTIGDEAAADLLGAREFAVVGVAFIVQDEEALDLRARHHRVLSE